jgi:hypothetical protein
VASQGSQQRHREAGERREHGLGARGRGGLVVASRVQQARDLPVGLLGHRFHLLVGWRRHRVEHRRAGRGDLINAVDHQCVEMDLEMV